VCDSGCGEGGAGGDGGSAGAGAGAGAAGGGISGGAGAGPTAGSGGAGGDSAGGTGGAGGNTSIGGGGHAGNAGAGQGGDSGGSGASACGPRQGILFASLDVNGQVETTLATLGVSSTPGERGYEVLGPGAAFVAEIAAGSVRAQPLNSAGDVKDTAQFVLSGLTAPVASGVAVASSVGGMLGVWAQGATVAGAFLTPANDLTNFTVSNEQPIAPPMVVFDGLHFAVVYATSGPSKSGIYLAQYDSNGNAMTPVVTLATGIVDVSTPSLAAITPSFYVVTWSQSEPDLTQSVQALYVTPQAILPWAAQPNGENPAVFLTPQNTPQVVIAYHDLANDTLTTSVVSMDNFGSTVTSMVYDSTPGPGPGSHFAVGGAQGSATLVAWTTPVDAGCSTVHVIPFSATPSYAYGAEVRVGTAASDAPWLELLATDPSDYRLVVSE
jgi:hypothetical protein